MQRVVTSGFIIDQGKALFLRRGDNEKFLPGYWELPGGKLDEFEEPAAGVLREIKEEANIDCDILGLHHAWHYITEYEGEKKQFVQVCFVLRPRGVANVKPADGMDDFAWITPDEVDKYQMSREMKKEIVSGFQWAAKNT